jgi:hypothetical protein
MGIVDAHLETFSTIHLLRIIGWITYNVTLQNDAMLSILTWTWHLCTGWDQGLHSIQLICHSKAVLFFHFIPSFDVLHGPLWIRWYYCFQRVYLFLFCYLKATWRGTIGKVLSEFTELGYNVCQRLCSIVKRGLSTRWWWRCGWCCSGCLVWTQSALASCSRKCW